METVQPIREIEDIENMIKVLREDSERNYILFITGIHLGMRISDILRLKKSDLKGKSIKIKEKKTKKDNSYKLSATLKKELEQYVSEMDDDDYLFQSRQGFNKPITRSQAYNILKSAAKKVGISDVGTHTLRKTFGYHFYKQEKDIALLMSMFNHSDPSITLRYIGITQQTKDNALRNFKIL